MPPRCLRLLIAIELVLIPCSDSYPEILSRYPYFVNYLSLRRSQHSGTKTFSTTLLLQVFQDGHQILIGFLDGADLNAFADGVVALDRRANRNRIQSGKLFDQQSAFEARMDSVDFR